MKYLFYPKERKRMKTIRIENNFARVCPGLKIVIIGAQLTNTEPDPRLW